MFQSGILFALFLAGCWLYCLTDAALTPAAEYTGLSKRAWVAFIAVTFLVGAIAWMISRQAWRVRRRVLAPPRAGAADTALARHPAGDIRRADPGINTLIGPDDDPEFLRMLDQRINGAPDSGDLPMHSFVLTQN